MWCHTHACPDQYCSELHPKEPSPSDRKPRAKPHGNIRCPYCGHIESFVEDTWGVRDSWTISRRRRCHSCQRTFGTTERANPLKDPNDAEDPDM